MHQAPFRAPGALQVTEFTARRRTAVRAALACVGWAAMGGGPAHAEALALPLSASLRKELADALVQRQPLVVLVSLAGCPWCEEVRRNYLAPMHAHQSLPVVQVDMRSDRRTRTAGGKATTHGALVRAWGVKVAPTLMFLGPEGREAAPRLVGGANDFYAAYLDARLQAARAALAS